MPVPVVAVAAVADVRPPVADVAAPAELASAARRLVADDNGRAVTDDDPGPVADPEGPIVTRREDHGSRPIPAVERGADRGHDLGMNSKRDQGLVRHALALEEPTGGLESAQLEPGRRVPLSGGPAGIEPGRSERVLEPGDLRGGQVPRDLPIPLARIRVDDLDHADR